MKPPKIKFQVTLRDLDFEGSLDDTIIYLTGLKEEYKNVENLCIEADDVISTGSYDSEVGYKYFLRGTEEETDAEYDKRIKMLELQKEREKARKEGIKRNKENKDREEYERLRKKFEGK